MEMKMKLLLILVALTSVLASAPKSKADSLPESVTIGFLPGENPEWLKQNGVKLAKALEEKLNVPVNIYISKNYDGLTEAMKNKKIDFAFFSAVTFVEAEKVAGAKVLLKKVWDGPFYYSAIITTKSTRINDLDGLKNKRFGWVDEKSASGYLLPRIMLVKKGVNLKDYFKEEKFFGQHEASIKALVSGKTDGVAVYGNDSKGLTGAWTQFAPKKGKDIKVLWVSGPIPNDPFCVRQDFYDKFPKFTHDMMFALIDFRDEPDEKNLIKTLYGISSLELATSKQYDPIREMVKYLKLKED
jgi:phosphonate transport system substrate-binding protein